MFGNSVIIEINPRLHLTLIGMNEGGYRINGGAGLAIQTPSLKIHCSISDRFSLIDKREFSLSEQEIFRIKKIIKQEVIGYQYSKNIGIEIQGEMPTHFGFGSGSAIRLACLEALHLLNKNEPEREKLVYSSGRGGTSGIGINTYFEGGFIVDLGKKLTGFPFVHLKYPKREKYCH